MAEFEHLRPHPIPGELDYSLAAELTDELFRAKGSAWTYYYQTSLVQAASNQSIHDFFKTISSQSRLVEPIQNDDFLPVDPLYRASHAFRAGMWSGGFMAEYVHGGTIDRVAAHNTLSNNLPFTAYNGQEQHEANRQFLLEVGEKGLAIIGSNAGEYIEQWADDIVSDENVRRYYALGAGAILCASHEYYAAVYENLRQTYEGAQLNAEISRYLADIADSSDN